MNVTRFPFLWITFTIVFFLIASADSLQSQISHGGEPVSFKTAFPEKTDGSFEMFHTLTSYQKDLRHEILTEVTPSGQAMRAGFSIQVHYTPEETGVWYNLGDSLWVWRMEIAAEKASSIGLVFENYHLAPDARLFIHTPEKDFFIGSFTHKNNNELQLLSAQAIPGERVIIEYSEKYQEGVPKFTNSHFSISEIIYLVNGLATTTGKGLGNSDECMINVNCSEGDQWQRQKRGIARLLLRAGNSWFWCSGSLINTTAHDGTPYLLTADHCGSSASPDDMNLWQFYFNFERPGCDNTGNPANNVLYGSTLISSGPLDGGSDFKLVLLHQRPPLAWRPYYNGWNNLDIPAESGVGIHHPSGDAKKISTFMGNVTSGGGSFSSGEVMADDSAWRFSFIETENGHSVTQGGSSGSPMFNQDGLIVGTLSGGSSTCTNLNGTNIYGKLSFHWIGHFDHPMHRLAPFLDPLETGFFFVRGYDPNIEANPSPGFVTSKLLNENEVKISWLKPGHAPNNPGWYGYTTTFTGSDDSTPERATVFDAAALGYNYPVTISKIAHVFRESPNDPWENEEFSFRIYGANGMDLLYSSPVMAAVSLEEAIHQLDTPLTFEDKFYVSVRPSHMSGHPSSAYNITNQGNSFSYAGHASDWQPVGNGSHQHVYLTSIYIEKDTHYPPLPDDENEGKSGFTLNKIYNTKNEWVDLVTRYRVYRNDEQIFSMDNEPGVLLSFTDNIEEVNEPFLRYYVTALYGTTESRPSNSTYVFPGEQCPEQITVFPFSEIFNDNELPLCWLTQNTAENGWILANSFVVDEETTILPHEGENMMLVEGAGEEQSDEWLLSPTFNISDLEVPALRFYFNAHFSSVMEDKTSQLTVYASNSENTFFRIWDTSESPLFRNSSTYTWIPAVVNIKELADEGLIRFGFQYTGEAGKSIALDKIEVFDAQENVHNLTLSVFPFESGEVYGAGPYIEGEAISITAYANTTYFFSNWSSGGQMLTWKPDYLFVMPGGNYHITANFTLDNVTSADDVQATSSSRIYPNPSSGTIMVDFAENMGNAVLEVFNASGRLVWEQAKGNIQAGEQTQVDLSGLTQGLYFVVIRSENQREVYRINIVR